MANLVGQTLGQYKVSRLIGEGGMAAVYQAHQESMHREVAIKVIKPNLIAMDDFVQRFEREAQMVASLSHPNILKVFDYGHHEDIVYLVMELMSGGSLEQLIQKGPLSLERSSTILDQIANALDYAHQKGIIHRDLKPGNVLLDESGIAFLTDFGLARLINSSQKLTQSGTAIGSPAYMAPEQWRGQPSDARTDVYALGVLLYQMLSGTLPFNGDSTLSMMYLHMHEPPPDLRTQNPAIPLAVEKVVEKALAKELADRFQSAGQLAAAFRTAIRPGKNQPAATPAQKTPIWFWAAAAVAVIIVVALVVTLGSRLLAAPSIPTVARLVDAAPTANPTALAADAIAPYTATNTANIAFTDTPNPTPTDAPAFTDVPTEVGLVSTQPAPGLSAPTTGNPTGDEPLSLVGHTGPVNSVAFSPDGRYIASGSDDKTARLWTVASGQLVRTFEGHTGAVESVAISPDGRYLLTGGADDLAILWDLQTGKQIRSFSGHTGAVNNVEFTPDGQSVLTASDDTTAKLWKTQTGTLTHTFSGAHKLAILSAAFSSDGRYLATASADKTAVIWNVQTGAVVQTLSGHTASVEDVTFSPDNRLVLTGSRDGTAKVWNAQNWRLVRTFDNLGEGIMAVTFAPDGRVALTAGEDGVVKSWDPLTGGGTRTMTSATPAIRDLTFAPPGILLIATGVSDNTVYLWPMVRPSGPPDTSPLSGQPGGPSSQSISPPNTPSSGSAGGRPNGLPNTPSVGLPGSRPNSPTGPRSK